MHGVVLSFIYPPDYEGILLTIRVNLKDQTSLWPYYGLDKSTFSKGS